VVAAGYFSSMQPQAEGYEGTALRPPPLAPDRGVWTLT
jgi:hypothetical protein